MRRPRAVLACDWQTAHLARFEVSTHEAPDHGIVSRDRDGAHERVELLFATDESGDGKTPHGAVDSGGFDHTFGTR